jgi:hypothetical protein
MCPRKYPPMVNANPVLCENPTRVLASQTRMILVLVRTCNGTCHLLLDNPNTIPIGKMKPHTVACKNIWIHRIASTGAFASSSETSSSCSCASAGVAARQSKSAKRVCRSWDMVVPFVVVMAQPFRLCAEVEDQRRLRDLSLNL